MTLTRALEAHLTLESLDAQAEGDSSSLFSQLNWLCWAKTAEKPLLTSIIKQELEKCQKGLENKCKSCSSLLEVLFEH